MEYNQFEGVIPEGEYGGGTVMIWDKGIWAPVAQDGLGDEQEVDRQLKKGDLKFVILGEKLAGSWVLVRTQGTRQWLLIKHKDDWTSADDLTTTKSRSIVSGRTMAEIARAAGASPRQLQQAAGTDPPSAPPAVIARKVAPSEPTRSSPSQSQRGRAPRRGSSQRSRVPTNANAPRAASS
jgi:bifunctional non-homologous end joining protein LigD